MQKKTDKKTKFNRKSPDLMLLPYRILGDRMGRITPLLSDLKDTLERSRLKIATQAYIAFIVFYSGIAALLIFIAVFCLSILVSAPLLWAILLSITFSLLTGSITFIVLYIYPSSIASSRKRLLDDELPYIASHMAVLSQAGLTPEAMFRSLALTESSSIKSIAVEEARDIVRDVYILGFDIVSAMSRSTRRSPSQAFSGFIDGMIGVTVSGGNLSNYFINSAKGFMGSARIAARQLVETLSGIAEAYVSLMVVFPLVAIVMLAVMGIIGGSLGGFSTISIMYLLAYLILPIFVTFLLVFLDSVMPPR